MARVVYDFYMTEAARALEMAYDSRKRKSYHLNRPLHSVIEQNPLCNKLKHMTPHNMANVIPWAKILAEQVT